MAISFPQSASVGQTYSSGSSATYQYNGTFWNVITPPATIFATAATASFSQTSSFVTLAQSASFVTIAQTASFVATASFSQTASFVATASTAISSSRATTSSFAITASVADYSKGRYAYWAPYLSTDPSGMGATASLGVNGNGGENGIQLTSQTTGYNASINWNSPNIDWTKDFRVSAVVYINKTEPSVTLGDGFVIYMGTTSPNFNIYANTPDGGLKYRLFTYAGAVDQSLNPSGSSFWVGSTKGPQGRTNTINSIGIWAQYVIEVSTDRVTNKRMALAYMQNESDYGGRWPLAGMDVTSWVPGGTNFGFFCATGAAKEDLYINSIIFEAL